MEAMDCNDTNQTTQGENNKSYYHSDSNQTPATQGESSISYYDTHRC